MIVFIKGSIASKGIDNVVIETDSGVGYQIFTTASALTSIGEVGSVVKIHTHYHVRDNAALLYGFPTKEELGIFKMLITVPGVGPKGALSVLSGMPPAKFSVAVVSGDAKALSKSPGIGLKTAQKIIIELGGKLKKIHGIMPGNADGENAPAAGSAPYIASGGMKAAEAVSALMVLGYTATEASRAVGDVYDDNLEIEIIIMKALKKMAII